MLELTTHNFNSEVLNLNSLILVDFWATWCGPCQMQGPILEELARDLKDKPIKIAKVNIEENQELTETYSITSVPTLILFFNGEIREQVYGLQSKDTLYEIVEKHLPKNNFK